MTDQIPDPDATVDEEMRRLRWQCRRGMLELDQILMPFLDHGYRQLDQARRADFTHLLSQQDQDLSNWFMSRAIPDDPRLHDLVRHILSVVSARAS